MLLAAFRFLMAPEGAAVGDDVLRSLNTAPQHTRAVHLAGDEPLNHRFVCSPVCMSVCVSVSLSLSVFLTWLHLH